MIVYMPHSAKNVTLATLIATCPPTRLNMQRAVREVALPEIQAIRAEIEGLRGEVRALLARVSEQTGR